MATILKREKLIQCAFTAKLDDGSEYTDAVYYSPESFAIMSDAEVDQDIEARVDAQVARLAVPSPVLVVDLEELLNAKLAERAALENEIALLQVAVSDEAVIVKG